jgi:WD40 repeat protein
MTQHTLKSRLPLFLIATILSCCLIPLNAAGKTMQPSSPQSSDATQGRPDIVWMRGGNSYPQGNPFFLADGQRFVTASVGTIQWWRVSDGILLKTVYAFGSNGLSDLALSPNKQIIAAVSNSAASAKLYNANDGAFLREIALSGNHTSYVVFSPDGQTMAINSGSFSLIQLWRVSDGALLRSYESPDVPRITGRPAFSTDGQYIGGMGTNNNNVIIVSVADGHLIRRYDLSASGYATDLLMFFSPNGQPDEQYFISRRQFNQSLSIWRLSDPCTTITCEPVVTLSSGASTRNIVFSPDGSKLAMGGATDQYPYQDINRIWDTSNWALIRSYNSNNTDYGVGAAVAFTPDGAGLLSVSTNMKLWSVADGSLVRNLEGHSALLSSVAYSPDGQIVASGTNTYASYNDTRIPGVYLWRASDGALLRTLDFGENLAGDVTSLAFSPDGQTVAVTGSLQTTVYPNSSQTRKVKLFNAATGALVRTIDFAGGEGIVFSPDGQMIATADTAQPFNATALYRVSDGALITSIDNLIPETLMFSPNGQRITDGRSVYQVSNGSFLFNLGGNPTRPNGASYSPDGQLMATVSWDTVRICSAANGTLVRELTGHTDSVQVVAFSPDNNALLSVGRDGTIRFWRVSDGALLQTYNQEIGFPSTPSGGAAFSPDGQFFIYGRREDATIVKARNPLVLPAPTTTFSTAAGLNVMVDAGDVRITFDSVLQSGDTTILPIDPTSTGLTPPVGHIIPSDFNGYEISTAAGPAPGSNIGVCLTVPNTVDAVRFARLRVLHGEGANLVDRTVSSNFSARQLCSRTTSLSPFVISEFTPSDTTAPIAGPTQSLVANGAGWNNSDVTVTWNWSDEASGSGIDTANCTTSSVSSGQGTLTLSAICKDLAGNTGNASYTVKIDSIKPTISAAATTLPNAAGWYNGDVTVHFTCTDTGSGIPMGACPADQLLTAEGMPVASSGQSVTDTAGNVSLFSTVVTVKIDKTVPTLNPTVSPNPVYLNSAPTATSGAADTLSGLASQSCGTLLTNSVGSKTVTCTATDNAGNTKSADASYTVVYNFTGFFQPVDNLPMVNITTAGSAIAVKFSLAGNQGLGIFFTGYPASGMIPCSTSDPGDVVEETVNAGGSSLTYNATTGQYNYVWKTDKTWKGTCRLLVVRFIDGTDHYAKFQFR